jgi:ADP-ribose pyrophosphatase YjhB (NUDIX family)
MNNWVCFAMLYDQRGNIILVQDNDKPKPYFWKMPGGRKEPYERFYAETITRELAEELLNSEARITTAMPLMKLDGHNPNPHMIIIFKGTCNQTVRRGKEIRKVKAFTKEEILNLIKTKKVLPSHAQVLKEVLVDG